MNILKKLFIAAHMTWSSYFPNTKESDVIVEAAEQQEPQPEMNEAQRMMHHDDVTPIEQQMLYSGDPNQIQMAREAIFIREAEVKAWWADKDNRMKDILGHSDFKNTKTIPMHEREGWEDDSMPEYYTTVIGDEFESDIVKVPYSLDEDLHGYVGAGEHLDEKYAYMYKFLIDVYNKHGKLTDTDYAVAEMDWENRDEQ